MSVSIEERRVAFDHRDPMLRPFIEVEAKIVRDVFGDMRRDNEPARKIVSALAEMVEADAESGARNMSQQLLGVGVVGVSRRGGGEKRRLPLACTEGCAHCCYGVVYASTPEILHIASWLEEHRAPNELTDLRARAQRVAEEIAPLNATARAQAKIPCPLLDTATNRCSVYEVRPVACRAYHSGSVEACKKAFDDAVANPILPIDPPLFHVAHAHAFGFMTALVGEGLDVGPYDLGASLPMAIEQSATTTTRWLAGEKVLRHTALSEQSARGYDAALAELALDLREGRLDVAEGMALRLAPSLATASSISRQERNRRKREKREKRKRR